MGSADPRSPGRPPLPPGAARTALIRARLTESMFDQAMTHARELGLSQSDYVRRAVLLMLATRR